MAVAVAGGFVRVRPMRYTEQLAIASFKEEK